MLPQRALLFGNVNVTFPDMKSLRTRFVFPNTLSGALVVYKYTPIRPEGQTWCSGNVVSHPCPLSKVLG